MASIPFAPAHEVVQRVAKVNYHRAVGPEIGDDTALSTMLESTEESSLRRRAFAAWVRSWSPLKLYFRSDHVSLNRNSSFPISPDATMTDPI